MILIADSGSTKTDWILWKARENESSLYQSKGLNPYFSDSNDISETLQETIPLNLLPSITKIYFYGAGCGSNESKKTVKSGLIKACPQAEIEVEHDLLAAARALCGKDKGIACILGTGSNSCLYNGKKIIDEGTSFGYIMGDEGSGNHLGRMLLKAIFTHKAPQSIIDSFKKEFPEVDLDLLLNQLYHYPNPNRFLAGFSHFIIQRQDNAFIKKLIEKSFSDFIEYFVTIYNNKTQYPVHFQGSIAWNYQDILRELLKKHNIELGKIIHRPIGHLLTYHQNTKV